MSSPIDKPSDKPGTLPESKPATKSADRAAELRRAALEYHEFPTPGKLAVVATKQMLNQHDLALAYSPGVAAACEEIVADPANAFRYTARGNLVGVITNGTAVLGLGDIGPLAQHRAAVGDDAHQVAASGVAEGVGRVGDDLFAGRRHAR